MLDKKKAISSILGGLFIIILSLGDERGKLFSNNIKLITGISFVIIGIVTLYFNSRKNQK